MVCILYNKIIHVVSLSCALCYYYLIFTKNISALAQAAKNGSLIDFKRVLRTSEDDIHRTDGVMNKTSI